MTIKVEVKLFAMLRERAGADSVEVELDDGATVDQLLAQLDGLVGALPVRAAVNREYAPGEHRLAAGDEVALIPPVSGGEDEVHAAVRREPLSLDRLAARVVHPSVGAVVSFQGITRDVERLDYEAYEEMAAERIRRIASRCLRDHELEAVAVEHRVGPVPLGEASVIVVAAAAHRSEAFAGARAAIDAIKAEVPIWKREIEAGRERWVEGETPSSRA